MKKPSASPKQSCLVASLIGSATLAVVTRLLLLFRRRQAMPSANPLQARTGEDPSPASGEPESAFLTDHLLSQNIALKRRLQELEQQVQGLEGRQTEAPVLPAASRRALLRKGLVAGLAVLLGAIPPALVVLDRWFGYEEIRSLLGSTWVRSSFLSQTPLPSYFVATFVCLAILLIFLSVVVRRRPRDLEPKPAILQATENMPASIPHRTQQTGRWLQRAAGVGYLAIAVTGFFVDRLPSWDILLVAVAYLLGRVLEDMPPGCIEAAVRRNARWLLSAGFAQLALILFLQDYYSTGQFEWAYALLLAVGLGVLYYNRREISPVVWVILFAITLYSFRIDSWRYSIIGDEYIFFDEARYIAGHPNILQIAKDLFRGTWVYGTHPYFSSLLQAMSMMLFGSDNFGWRLSSVYLGAMSIGFFFLFFKTFLSERVALVSSVLLAASHYLMNFGKIGYDNLQALFVMAVVLWAGGNAARTRRPLAFTGLGLAMAACFYVYPAALYVLPLPILLLLFYVPPTSRSAVRLWSLALASLSLLLLPLFFQPAYWQAKIAGTVFYNPEILEAGKNTFYHFASNLLYALISYVYIHEETHFVVSSYMDPLTAVFVPIGIALVLGCLRKERFASFLGIAFVVECIFIGTTHDRPFPPATRMFLMLPWFALFGALGLDWAADQAKEGFSWKWTAKRITGLVLIAVVAVNLYQALRLFPQRMRGSPSMEVLFLRMLQYDSRENPSSSNTYLFITDESWGIDGIRRLQMVYGVPDSQAQLMRAVAAAENPHLPDWAIARILEEDTVVILQPSMDESLQEPVKTYLQQLGRVSCVVRETPEADLRFVMWVPPGLEGLCTRAAGS